MLDSSHSQKSLLSWATGVLLIINLERLSNWKVSFCSYQRMLVSKALCWSHTHTQKIIFACWPGWLGVGQFIAQRLSPTQEDLLLGYILLSLPWSFSQSGTVRGWEYKTSGEGEARAVLLAAAFVPWLATPTWMARLRPRAEQDSRTRPHQLPLLPASQTWYRHGALHCMTHAQQ